MKSGGFVPTKSAGDNYTMEEKKYPKRSEILVATIASGVTLVVAVTVVVSLFFGTHLCMVKDSDGGVENFLVQISDSPSDALITVLRARKLIRTTTLATDTLDHTITLQDYNRDLQAVKDLKRNQCYVLPVFKTFEEAYNMTQSSNTTTSRTSPTVIERTSTRESVPEQMLPWLVGEHITELCAGVPTYFLFSPEEAHHLQRRLSIEIHLGPVCIKITF